MMTKYYSAILLFPLFLLLLREEKTRAYFKKPALYVGLLTFVLIITPHIFWLFQHDFLTIHYALEKCL